MKHRAIRFCLAVAAALAVSCESWEETTDTISENLYVMTLPDFPKEAWVATNLFGSDHLRPWKPANPFTYEGTYEGERGDTIEYLQLEIFGKGDTVQISGTHTVTTAGRAPSVSPIETTELNLAADPFFKDGKGHAFFAIFTAHPEGPLPEPVAGVILGGLFLTKNIPPSAESDRKG